MFSARINQIEIKNLAVFSTLGLSNASKMQKKRRGEIYDNFAEIISAILGEVGYFVCVWCCAEATN